MLFVESRTAVIDVFPVAFAVAAYLLFHLHLRADSPGRQRWTIVVTGLILGLGLASKWTALAAYGTIVVLLAVFLWRGALRYDRRSLGVAILSLGLLPGLVYGLSFTHYLTVHHSLDGFGQPALALIPFHLDLGHAWQSLVNFHRWTFNYHYTLKAPRSLWLSRRTCSAFPCSSAAASSATSAFLATRNVGNSALMSASALPRCSQWLRRIVDPIFAASTAPSTSCNWGHTFPFHIFLQQGE